MFLTYWWWSKKLEIKCEFIERKCIRFWHSAFIFFLGKMPNVKVLKRYSLLPFSEVRSAVIAGDLLSLSKALDKHQAFFIRAGIYLILEKLKIITYRNLFKKTALILGTHQLPIEVLLTFFQSASKRYRLLKHFGKRL